MTTASSHRHHSLRQWLMAILLSSTALLAGLWMLAARFTSNYVPNFRITATDFATFSLDLPGRTVLPVGAGPDPVEQNILMYRVMDNAWAGRRALARLVHGYNMHDCMRIKGYEVVQLSDQVLSTAQQQLSGPDSPFRLQVWALSSPTGDRSIWTSIMIRSGDFAPTMLGTRSMAFPKASIPDDPNWVPRGLTRASLKHPLESFAVLIRAQWNKARNDILTFLRLKKPVQASDELLTVIGYYELPPAVQPGDLEAATRNGTERATELALELVRQLQRWHKETNPARSPP